MKPGTRTTYRLQDGLSQVTSLIDAYWERRAQLEREARPTYHSEFYDLPGVADTEKPETPIYLLSELWSLVKLHDEQAQLVEQGWIRVTDMPPRTLQRHSRVVLFFSHYVGEGSYRRLDVADVRLYADVDGRPAYLLPKGRRTQGILISGTRAVYVAAPFRAAGE
ncbi:MAG TPA: hypothetical protein VGL78_04205 [Solirubrobacteraceae bacterium]|jgi:hypothetical protein